MATAVSARPVPPHSHQKSKRPPPPTVQTSVNGVKSSQSSPSPSMSSKRPPSCFQQPQRPNINGTNGSTSGTAARMGNRRRESQKPGDISVRVSRTHNRPQGDGIHGERRTTRRIPEPFIKTTQHMLKKYSKVLPSFILHLHPTHFRFDQQDGSFSYNSPVKILLEHIKSQTIPHDMLDELKQAGIKFYENCLIVQIQDHRRNSSTSQTSSATAKQDRNLPFSIHNYSEHLTPSPYVPYPLVHDNGGNDGSQSSSKPSAAHPEPVTLEHDRREGLSHGQHTSSVTTNPQEGPRIFTTVLFPTPKSLEEEVRVLASTPDLRALGRKQSQANARPSSSATASHPPTPSSAIPSTPMSSAPPAKKQKMLFTGPDLAAVEGRFIASTAQPLFLDPVDSQEEAQELLAQLHDPLFCEELPVPKTRKRTVRELEADEALAAAEQQFMLVMDERLVPSATGAASHNAGTADGDSSIVSFEPRFERFKAIEEIRLAHREKAQREAELKAQQNAHQQLLKTKQEQQARENQLLQEQRMGQFRKQEQMRQVQNSQIVPQTHQLMQQQHVPPGSNQHGHPQMSNTMLPNSQSLAISQAHHSSPIVRNMTPHNNISPLVGDNTMTHGGQGVPMKVTTSNQGAGSPPRPGSAVQHGHPSGSAGMAPQRSQQPPTRNGTPQIPGGTPRLQQAVPVMRNVTPTPRMTHGSPGTSGMVATPIIGHAMMPTPHINGQHLTPQQQQILNMQQRQAQSGMQGSPPAGPSPPNLAQLAALRAQQQSRQNNQVYQQQLRQMTHQQMSGVPIGSSQYHNVPVGMQPQGLMQPQNLQTRQPDPRWQAMAQKIWADTYSQFLAHAQAQYGQNNVPGEVIRSLRDRAKEQAIAQVTRRQAELNMRQAQEQAQEQAQQQAMQQRAMMQQIPNGGMSGGGGMNGRPMNGMNGMNAMNGR